jgi:hypothetical protein
MQNIIDAVKQDNVSTSLVDSYSTLSSNQKLQTNVRDTSSKLSVVSEGSDPLTEFRRLSKIETGCDTKVTSKDAQTAFVKAQRSDPVLQKAFELAREKKRGFVLRDNILYKRRPTHVHSGCELLLCVPQP